RRAKPVAREQQHDREPSALARRRATHDRETARQAAAEKHAGNEPPGDEIRGSLSGRGRTLSEPEPGHREQNDVPLSEAIRERRKRDETDALANEIGR